MVSLEKIIKRISDLRVDEEMEDYEVTDFFDKIRDELTNVNDLSKSQKEALIKALFGFLKNQDPEMDENFSFIHFIENIDNPDYETYNIALLNFIQENGTITSTLLFNRYINSLKGAEWEHCVNLMKSISENENYTEYIREYALDFYKYQIEK